MKAIISSHNAGGAGNNQKDKVQAEQKTQEQTRQVTWIEATEPQKTQEVVYTPPADVRYPYFVKVNRAMGCVTVYGIDSEGKYTIPVKAFTCSVGREGEETIVGEGYRTSDKYEWRLMVDYTYGMYAYK